MSDAETLTRPQAREEGLLPNQGQPDWIVQKDDFDAAKPYAVVATFRSFNKVKARYASDEQAKRRARDLNRAAKTSKT